MFESTKAYSFILCSFMVFYILRAIHSAYVALRIDIKTDLYWKIVIKIFKG